MQDAECKLQDLKCGADRHPHRAFGILHCASSCCIRRCAFCILHFAFVLFVMLLAIGCNRGAEKSDTSAATPQVTGRQSLKPVSFPDISGATPSVQKQLRDAQASFDARTQGTTISDAALAQAYGETGMLLLAAEY